MVVNPGLFGRKPRFRIARKSQVYVVVNLGLCGRKSRFRMS